MVMIKIGHFYLHTVVKNPSLIWVRLKLQKTENGGKWNMKLLKIRGTMQETVEDRQSVGHTSIQGVTVKTGIFMYLNTRGKWGSL